MPPMGSTPKAKPIDMSKQPECIKMRPEGLKTEEAVTGPGSTLANVTKFGPAVCS